MDECKIGVGGCSGQLYVTCLEYANELEGPAWKHMLLQVFEKRYAKEWRAAERQSLFKGLWLDLDADDVRGLKSIEERGQDGDYYGGYYYLYNGKEVLTNDLKDKMVNRLGYKLDAPGFIHRPELQMIAFGDLDINEAICGTISDKIESIDFDSLFFFVGLGGGTGTGVIGNLTNFIEKSGTMKASFVLGVLTGKNDDRLGMLTKKEDEQSPKKANSESIRTQAGFHRRTFNAMWALSDLLAGKKVECVILVDNDKLPEIEEVKKELGKRKGEGAGAVLDRYIIKSIFPLLGKNEIEQIDESELKKNMRRPKFRPIFVPCYWHGKMDLKDLIKNAVEKGKLADCDHTTANNAIVITKGFMDDEDTIKDIVKRGLQKAGVNVEGPYVGRTRKVGGADPKDKEVLILLQNPGLKDLLSERIEAAINFIRLTEIIERIESTMEQEITLDISSKEARAASLLNFGAHFEALLEKDAQGKKLLDELKDTISKYNPKNSEEELRELIGNAWELLHAKDEFHFTEEVVLEERRFLTDFKEELLKVKERIENGERELFEKHVSIKLGCLASIQSRCLFSWDRGIILSSLQEYLGDVNTAQIRSSYDENEGISLYTIEGNGGELLATFKRMGESGKAKLKRTNGSQINIKVDWYSKMAYEAQFEEELNSRVISEELQNEFQKRGNLFLSNTVTVTVLTKDKKWLITDEEKRITYRIFAENEELNCYEYLEGWLSKSSGDEKISKLTEEIINIKQHIGI